MGRSTSWDGRVFFSRALAAKGESWEAPARNGHYDTLRIYSNWEVIEPNRGDFSSPCLITRGS